MKRSFEAPLIEQPQMESEQGTQQTTVHAPKMSSLLTLVSSMEDNYGSAETEAYVSSIREYFDKPLPSGHKVSVNWVSAMPGLLSLTSGKKAVLLVFTTFFNNINERTPKTTTFKEAMDTFDSVSKDKFDILNMILVDPVDYPKIKIMQARLANLFLTHLDDHFKNLTISSFTDSGYVINPNTNDVKDKLNQYYPHAVMPRADYGFCLYRKPLNDQHYNNRDYFSYQQRENEFLACVTAYTDVVAVPNKFSSDGVQIYLPVIHISSITSVVPLVELTSLILPIATDVFINYDLWKAPLMSTMQDQKNVGKLFVNPEDGSLGFAASTDQVNNLIRSYFEKPTIVLDIVEGVYRIPGIEMYMMASDQINLQNMYSDFCHQKFQTNRVSQLVNHEYIGVVTRGSKSDSGDLLIDSRWCDYLSAIVYHESDYNTVRGLLNQVRDPQYRVNILANLYPNFKVTNSNMVCLLDLPFMFMVQNSIRNFMSINTSGLGGMSENIISLDHWIANGNSYYQAQANGYGMGGTMTMGNPFASIYGGNRVM